MSKRKTVLKRIISAVLVLLLLALILGAIYKFTDVGDIITDLLDKDFRVELDGLTYKGDDNKITLRVNEQMRFIVKGANGYKVTITPNVTDETDFVYTVDGLVYRYSDINLSKVFLSQDNTQSGYFLLNALDDYTIESVLSKVYEGKTVIVNNSLIYPYVLTITSKDKTIRFLICIDDVTGITLDCENIIF